MHQLLGLDYTKKLTKLKEIERRYFNHSNKKAGINPAILKIMC
jgi:hypothetical protein